MVSLPTTSLRIRRVTREEELWASLAADEPDLLPLCFTDAEREELARTVDLELAALADGEERSYATLGVATGASDAVLATTEGPALRFATRYAAITGRRLLPVTTIDDPTRPRPSSLTWFCALDETDLASALAQLHEALARAWGATPLPIGVLTAQSMARLSWLLAKQLLARTSADDETSTTVVSSEPAAERAWASLTCVGADTSAASALSTIEGTTGTILINGHSRPHCGLLPTAERLVGLCGLPTGGAGGRCVRGTACHFGEAPRVVLQQLQARRVFFNGCTTAGVGTRRRDFLPAEAMVGHATLRGGAREYVGNVRTGLYGEEDLDWFLGASALGFTPAASVAIVEAARSAAGREVIASALYFGDATNGAWPVQGVVVGEVAIEAGQATLRWPRPDRVLVASLPGSRWAELARHDRLHVRTRHPSSPAVEVVVDPWSDASLVLAVPRSSTPPGDAGLEPVIVELVALADPIDRTLGDVLAPAIAQLRELEGAPTFTAMLSGAPAQLEQELVALRRAAAAPASLTLLPERLHHWRDQEARAARRFDAELIATALARAEQRWSWSAEYIHRMQAIPRPQPTTCPSCGGHAIDIDYRGYAESRLRRTTEVCGYCGIVLDVPQWPLQARFVDQALAVSPTELAGRVEVTNAGERSRTVTLGAAVRGAGRMRSSSRDRVELEIGPAQTATFELSLIPEAPMFELMQTWVFIACEGALGLIGRMLLFGRDPARARAAAHEPTQESA